MTCCLTLPVELLLADNSHAHLFRMASVGPAGEGPGCTVDSPDRCPAARRAQVQTFANSDVLDACPEIRVIELQNLFLHYASPSPSWVGRWE